MDKIYGGTIGEPTRREEVVPLVRPRRVRREVPQKAPAKAPAKPRREKVPA
jgi:hypothetical protein